MARYTLTDAAYEVLRLAGHPMKEHEIRERAVQNHFITSGSPASIKHALVAEARTGGRFIEMRVGFGLHEWANAADPELVAQYEEAVLEQNLRRWLQALREVTAQLRPLPAANTLCLWTELCYRLGLKEDVRQVFQLVVDEEADPWLFNRARRFYRLCQEDLE